VAERRISLTADEALVLFELLHRWESEEPSLPLERGEREALWSLSAALEKVLAEPFDSRYAELLDRARARLASGEID
jgi:hypothetical protein